MRILAIILLLTVIAPLDSGADDQSRACSAAERKAYAEQLAQAVHGAWQPPDFGEGYRCVAIVALNFRGEVLNVGVEECSRDDLSIHKSVEDAAYDASPLPLPGNRSCLDRTMRLRLVHRVTD